MPTKAVYRKRAGCRGERSVKNGDAARDIFSQTGPVVRKKLRRLIQAV